MLDTVLKFWKFARNVPKLFVHFPGPSLVLVGVAMVAAATAASCVTHKLDAGEIAETKIELAQCRIDFANARAAAAEKREHIITGANEIIREVAVGNQRAWLEQLAALTPSPADKAALLRIAASIEELHNDPRFDCRRLPLPPGHIDSVSFGPEEVRPAAAPGNP